jgi:hypothetical protein
VGRGNLFLNLAFSHSVEAVHVRYIAGLTQNRNQPKYDDPSSQILANRLSEEIEGLSD